jgi:predicted phage replisome organizer
VADETKYYYLKLKENFFDGEDQKVLESIKNGGRFQNLYLKMCCLSLKAGGKLIFKDVIPYDIEMLSTVLRVSVDTVKMGIEVFQRLKLIEVIDDGTIYMNDIQSLIGHGSTESERKAKYRARIEADKHGTLSGQNPPELELEIETEIEGRDNGTKSPPPSDELFSDPLEPDGGHL